MIQKHRSLFSLVIIVGLLSFGINEMKFKSTESSPSAIAQVQAAVETKVGSVISAVLEDAAQRSQLPVAAFDKITAERTTWSDGCLGIEKPGEFCTQALVPGWRITLSYQDQTWVYHTSTDGRIRLASKEDS